MATNSTTDPSPFAGNQLWELTNNLANIGKIKRMWRAQWPEFSWLTQPGAADPQQDPNKNFNRCYQMFAPDISRVGYGAPDPKNNNHCRVWSVMCPQQGIWIPALEGTLNVEVTVTGTRGWATEDPMLLDAQITIEPRIWFSPDTVQTSSFIKLLWAVLESLSLPFPFSKETAIRLNAYGVDQPNEPILSSLLNITSGLDPSYKVPAFATHNMPDIYNQKAATTVYVAVEIGEVKPANSGNADNDAIVDWFNNRVMELFNLASGNLLQNKNILSWNIWALAPEEVLRKEWEMHAEYWRFSLDVNHRSPEGNGRDAQYYNGLPFLPLVADIIAKLKQLLEELIARFPAQTMMHTALEREITSLIDKHKEAEQPAKKSGQKKQLAKKPQTQPPFRAGASFL